MSDSINSLSNSSAANNAHATGAASDAKEVAAGDASPADADGSGQPDSFVLQQGKLFRTLLAGPDSEERRPELLVRGGSVPARAEDDDDGGESNYGGLGDGLHRGNVDIAAQLLAQRLLEAGPLLQGTPAAAAAPDPTFAELMVKHIRRALVSADAADDSGGEVRLEMSDAVLPGTVLSLRRTEEGWQLHAVTANAQSRQTLSRFAPTLIERFAQGSLGQLRISLDASPGA
jgi:hypothetical protein